MRIQEILGHLQHSDGLDAASTLVINSTPQAFALDNRQGLIRAFSHLKQVAPLRRDTLACENHSGFVAPSVQVNVRAEFQRMVNDLSTSANALRDSLHQCVELPDPEALAIRLPEDVTNLTSLKSVLDRFEVIFSTPTSRLFPEGRGIPQFRGFDVGTDWINILHSSKEALDVMLLILNIGAQLRQRRGESKRRDEEHAVEERAANLRKTEAEARIAEAGADVAEARAKAQVRQAEVELEKADQELEDIQTVRKGEAVSDRRLLHRLVEEILEEARLRGASPEAVNESRVPTEKAVEGWASMLNEGSTVQHALNAPQELSNAFPSPELSSAQLTTRKQLLASNPADANGDAETGELDEYNDGDADEGGDG